MMFEFSITIKFLFVNTLILIALAIYTFKYRSANGGIYLFLLLIVDAIWSLCSAFEQMSDTVFLKVFWSKISYLGVSTASLLLFLFILLYCGRGKKLTLLQHILLWIIPFIIIIAAFTNDLHGLIWTSVDLIPNETGFGAQYNHGILFWVMVIYSYILLAIGSMIVISTAYKSHNVYKRQLFTLIIALIPPWLGNFIYLTGLAPFNLDLTPITFSLTGIIIILGIFRFQLLNIAPIAYDTMFRSMTNGVLVLDKTMRLINFNSSVLSLIPLTEKHIGQLIQNVPGIRKEIIEHLINSDEGQVELQLKENGVSRWLDIKTSSILNQNNYKIGSIFIFWDITESKKIEENIKKSEKVFAQINDCLINLSADYETNINSLTKICGEILGATCALYNRIDSEMLCSIGQWNTPTDYNPIDKPDGHICYDVIKRGKKKPFLVNNLQNSSYSQSDPNVSQYSLKTYGGHAVFCGKEVVGSICVVFQEDRKFDAKDLGVLSIIASALSSEEQRLRDKEALRKSEEKYHEISTLFRLMSDNMHDMLWAKNLNQEYIFANKAMCEKLLNAKDTNEPIGKTDLYFAKREREAHLDKPEWHTFGEICANTDEITLQELKPMRFDEYGNVKNKFLFLEVHKAPIYNDNGQLIGVVGSARDVTNEKSVEIQNRKLSQAVEQSPSSIVITNLQGSIEYVNPKFTQVTGYSYEEAIGKTPRILKSNEHADEFYKELWQTIKSGNEWKGTFHNKKKNGELFWELAFISPIVNDKGVITNFISIKEDVTAERQTQEKLTLTKDTYQSIFNSISESIYVLDENGIFIDVNRGAEIMYGYTKDEIIGKTPAFVSAPDRNDLQNVALILNDAYQSGNTHSFEFWGLRKNNQIFPKEVIISKGTYFGKECIIATARDITERKRNETSQLIQYNIAQSSQTSNNIEEFLETVRLELGKLFDTSNFFVALLNIETNILQPIIFRNEKIQYEEWFTGQSISYQVIKLGKTVYLKNKEMVKFCKQNNIKELENDALCCLGVPLRIQNKVAGVFLIQHYTNPNAYSNSDIAMFEMVAHETGIYIEKQKMIEDILAAKEKAEESDRLKSAFLQNMSHEVRTPLNSIIGFSELINNPDIDVNVRKFYTDIIIERGWHLTEIINDILTISSLETKQEQLYIDKINVNKLIKEQLILFGEQAQKKGIKLISKIQLADIEADIYVDKTKIGQILSNFFTNAIKFTSEGEIELGCRKKDFMLEFFVRDSGIGIDSSKLNLIFERFVQADDSIRRNYGGTGLGLSICQGFVKLMGGEIWVESELGKGSTFSFSIPYHPVEKTHEKDSNSSIELSVGGKKLNVLVAEDEEVNFLYLNILLKKYDFNIFRAHNGQEAVDFCSYEAVDIVLMDIKMPKMDGYTAAKLIKEINPKLPIIAQTAHAAQSEIEQFRDVFDDYITKPFTAEKLKVAFNKLFNTNKQ